MPRLRDEDVCPQQFEAQNLREATSSPRGAPIPEAASTLREAMSSLADADSHNGSYDEPPRESGAASGEKLGFAEEQLTCQNPLARETVRLLSNTMSQFDTRRDAGWPLRKTKDILNYWVIGERKLVRSVFLPFPSPLLPRGGQGRKGGEEGQEH